MLFEWQDGLKLRGSSLYFDSRRPRACCFVSHGHTDHLPSVGRGGGDVSVSHGLSICTAVTAAIGSQRVGLGETGKLVTLGYDEPFNLDPSIFGNTQPTRLKLLPAGHVLGSAMLHVTRDDGTLLYTGDFKLGESATVERARPEPADVLVMESTYGRPQFRFPPREQTVARLVELVEQAFRDGRQPIVMGYSLGKAQELVRLCYDAGFNVTQHGAVASLSDLYNRFGVDLGRTRRYRTGDFHGPHQLDLRERGVLVAPPNVARSAFVTRFDNPLRIVLTGWALTSGAIYRYGVDHALPISDHADFGELLETIEIVRPKKVYTHHGFAEFVDELKHRGIDAQLARPPVQMSLF